MHFLVFVPHTVNLDDVTAMQMQHGSLVEIRRADRPKEGIVVPIGAVSKQIRH